MPEAKKKIWETPQILSDLPLRETDQAHFHFDEFAGTLARLIADPATRTPLTIGVSGAWGSGKTTLLQRVQKKLDETGKKEKPSFANENETAKSFRTCKTVWFDAWKYSDEDKLLVALVRVILGTMERGNLREQFWGEVLDKTAPRYDVLATFLNMFKAKFGGLEIGIDLGKYKTETPFAAYTAFFDHFNSALEELLARWVHGKGDFAKIDEHTGALVIFVDDLDRCLPAKTVQVLEAIKLFLDKPGCVFVLGAHTDIVQQAVTKYYQDAGVTGENASDYLEKIIQLRFDLPPILENQMGDFVTAQGLPTTAIEHWDTIVAGAEINPRKVKTFLNDLNLAWALLVNSGQAQNVERADFTRWQVLMRAAPETFKKQVRDIDDLDLRFSFVQRALAWQNGEAQAAEYFKDYESNSRLKRTLKKIHAFTARFDAKSLDAFIHLTAPPKPPEPEKVPAEVKEKAREPMPSIDEREALEVGAEVFAEKVMRGEVGTEKDARRETAPGRAGIQVFGGLEFVPVPKGKFLMGSRDDNKLASGDEKPQHTVEIPSDYWMARFPITNEQYDLYVQTQKGKHPVSGWQKKKDHPVVNVSWNDAQAYCKWLNETQSKGLPKGSIFHLPTEAEWEKAARGEFGFEWPWGNEFDKNKCNSGEGGKKDTTPVGAYSPAGDGPYGAADMVGNVWEWMHSLHKPYPYQVNDGREAEKGTDARVLRGGSSNDPRNFTRCSYRGRYEPGNFYNYIGFRLVCSSSFHL
jgi:formylglycine-generating enzyme required for sulfatase activity/tRNA A37 threonylcarbamoyladenosine biosynthesis protein TsaE